MIKLATFTRVENPKYPAVLQGTLSDGRIITVEKHSEDPEFGYFYRVVIQDEEALRGWFNGHDHLENTLNAYTS